MHCLIGEKIGITRIFDEDGKVVSVTIIKTEKNKKEEKKEKSFISTKTNSTKINPTSH